MGMFASKPETYEVRLPNGRVVRREAPAGATDAQVRALFSEPMRGHGINALAQAVVRPEQPQQPTNALAGGMFGGSLKSYTPTLSERIGNTVGDALGSQRFGRGLTNFLSDWTPAGNIDGITHGSEIERQLSALPLPGPARRAAGAAVRAVTPKDLERGFNVIKVGPTTMEITSDGKYARLNMIKTPPEARGQGSAKRALEELTMAADEAGITLDLTAQAMDAATSVKKLREFYTRYGFVPNKGRNKDFYTQAEMIRPPRR